MDKHKQSENKILVIVLCVLVFIIIGLVTSIIIVDVSKKGAEGESNGGNSSGSQSAVVDGDDTDESGSENDSDNNDEKEEDGENSDSDKTVPTVGTADPVYSGTKDLPVDQEQDQIQKQIVKTYEMQDYVKNISRDEALKYVDGLIAETDDANDKFNIQLFKANLYFNAGNVQDALKVCNEIGDVSGLIMWNRKSYYDILVRIYTHLDDQANVEKYRQLSQDMYDILFDGGEGYYE